MFDIIQLLKSDTWCTMSDMTTQKVAVYSLGERIRKAREDMGWQQADLADGVKKSRATIAGWENNKHRPSPLELDFIATLTGYPIEFFLDNRDEGLISNTITSREGAENYLDNTLFQVAA